MKTKKILVVVTSHAKLGNTGKPTGYYLPELTHPLLSLEEAGFDFDIASLQGGNAPMDPNGLNMEDTANRKYMAQPKFKNKTENTLKLKDVNPEAYDAVLFAGGHGTMFDFSNDPAVNRVTAAIYDAGGVVAAVCHGPAALTDVQLSSGKYLVDGKTVSAFTNEEEEAVAVGLTQVVPFLLETKLKERGAKHTSAPLFKSHVVIDGRLVTGQNPASAHGVGKAMVQVLSKIERD